MSNWFVYIIERKEKLYVGITTELERRLAQHNGEQPGGAKSTRAGRRILRHDVQEGNNWGLLRMFAFETWPDKPGKGMKSIGNVTEEKSRVFIVPGVVMISVAALLAVNLFAN